ncbi:phosphotriesterase-related protein isoform X2 [Patella vulgata]|uniref:phosphotriesterase-related protein isoform X2 n=1 Tax=Patella vulgata TaxID=6465 RepID=UPI00217FE40A|nr:phosphotriesterase-related protein isoform X2 [Patella vulgata]
MSDSNRVSKIQTVTGLISPEELGQTLTHEHLSINASSFFVDPCQPRFKDNINKPFTLENYGWIQHNPYSHKPNLQIDTPEEQTVIQELKYFKENGGDAMVENSTIGLHADVEFLKRASEETGVKIIASTGFYVDSFQSEEIKQLSIEKLCGRIQQDLTQGVEGTGIKCGVIGEVGCTWPLTDFEKRSIRAAAISQQDHGAPVIFHPGRNQEAPFEILRIFTEAGGKAEHSVMSHLDRTLLDESKLLEFARQGMYCEYDHFGIEVSDYKLCPTVDMPTDAQRIKAIRCLIDNAFEDKILIAHDIHTKHRLMKYGGHGFSHILINVLPHMKRRGITQQHIDKILVQNPRKWLTFTK